MHSLLTPGSATDSKSAALPSFVCSRKVEPDGNSKSRNEGRSRQQNSQALAGLNFLQQ
jgi:hypothetical protein